MLTLDLTIGRWDLIEEFTEHTPNTPAYSDNPVAQNSGHMHVVPYNDQFPHVLSLTECWCKPVLDEDSPVVTHNSADGREYYQNGERSLH